MEGDVTKAVHLVRSLIEQNEMGGIVPSDHFAIACISLGAARLVEYQGHEAARRFLEDVLRDVVAKAAEPKPTAGLMN